MDLLLLLFFRNFFLISFYSQSVAWGSSNLDYDDVWSIFDESQDAPLSTLLWGGKFWLYHKILNFETSAR
jgi:hypothetical protein